MAKQVTMKQIAGELGISRWTVSMILNNNAKRRGIAADTINRVQSYIKERGYVPSRQALDLRNGKSESIGILYCGRLYSHLTEAFNRITGLANTKPEGLQILVVPRQNLEQGVQELLARGVTKLVWIHTIGADLDTAHTTIPNYLARFETVVLYNYHFMPEDNARDLTERGFYLVGVDRLKAYTTLAAFIKKLGHKKVALVDFNTGSEFGRRCLGVFDHHGLDIVSLQNELAVGIPSNEFGSFYAKHLLTAIREKGITAACFHDDERSCQTIPVLKQQGIRIPEDLTVTGYDNMPYTQYLDPPLTTLAVPVEKMVNVVHRILDGKEKNKRRCFDLELIPRGTHKQLPK